MQRSGTVALMRALLRLISFALLVAALAWGVMRLRETGALDALTDAIEDQLAQRSGDAPRDGDRTIRLLPGEHPDESTRPTRGRPDPRDVAGQPLRVELAEEPTTHYSQGGPSDSDDHYRSLARQVGGLRYEATLGHAARELAVFHSAEGQLAPGDVLTFFLDAGGAAEWGVEQMIRVTSAQGDQPIIDQLQRVLETRTPGSPIPRVGVGEAYTMDRPPRRHIAVLIARGELELDRVPRTAEAGERVTVAGRVPASVEEMSVLVMGPDLEVREAGVTWQGDRFSSRVSVGDLPGAVWIELIANGPGGPKPLAQLDVRVADDLPWELDTAWPPDESALRTAAEAEAHAWRLINADRGRFGLDPLPRVPTLDRVARGHSDDMAAHGFFGHVSPSTGSVSDRLRVAELKTVLHAENIARNESLHDAEAGLMRSLGHRRNILLRNASEVGVGVATTGEGPQRQWIVTQVFGRPSPVIEPETARQDVLDALAEAREHAGLAPLREDASLGRVAAFESQSGDPTPRSVLDRARSSLKRGGWAWVATLNELRNLEVPDDVLERSYRRVGVGVHQDRDRDGPDIVVVLLVGG